jgi:CRISPR-associated exonuclease Cas4
MAVIALAAFMIGLLLIVAGKSSRKNRGLTDARTVDLDNRTLYSRRYGLAGRPDRIIVGGIPEEWKSGARVYDSHRAQLATYFTLIEEETGIAPPYGVLVLGSGELVTVKNSPELLEWVLGIAGQIRAARRDLEQEIPVRQPAAKCRACGMREGCGQRME